MNKLETFENGNIPLTEMKNRNLMLQSLLPTVREILQPYLCFTQQEQELDDCFTNIIALVDTEINYENHINFIKSEINIGGGLI